MLEFKMLFTMKLTLSLLAEIFVAFLTPFSDESVLVRSKGSFRK
jgi:hypothetical protein